MFRAMFSPIIRSTWLYLQHLLVFTQVAAGWCYGWVETKSALHVPGDVFAHNQEHLTVFTVSANVHPSCCRLVLWMSWNEVSSTCFGRCFRPSLGTLDCIYSFWYYSPKLLPAGVMNELERSQLYMFRAMFLPIIRSTWLYLQFLVVCTQVAAGWCYGWVETELSRLWVIYYSKLALNVSGDVFAHH